MQEVECDILIVGGSAGGVAAAWAAGEAGASVCLLEETDWLGGQLTTQGVCTPDEQAHIETFGGTRRYVAFRNAVRTYYKNTYALTPEAAERPYFNPGNCWVSHLSFEPKVGERLLRESLAPLVESGRLRLFLGTWATACELDPASPDRIAALIAQSGSGETWRFTPRFVLDATDLGELLPLCGGEGADWTTGAESRAETGEPDAPETPRPDWVQPFTFPFALDWSPETADSNVITPPDDYEELKAQQRYHVIHGAITGLFAGAMPWWSYRRVLAAENFADSRIPADLAMINTAGNDYYGGNILGTNAGDATQQQAALARARRASLGYVYWLQTECPREPAGHEPLSIQNPESKIHSEKGYPEFRLRKDIFDTEDGCSIRPYIREARRIKARRPILEQEIVVRSFQGEICRGEKARAAFMPDSVGIGHYALDIHPNGHGEPNHYVATRPFQIPLDALIPVRLQNLLPACKNLGTTHLTNGAYRLHPIEWNIGESAALLAAFCAQESVSPHEVTADADRLRRFQTLLLENGIPLHWYIDVPLDHPAFAAVQTLACFGLPLGSETDLLFRPDEKIAPETWRLWRETTAASTAPEAFEGMRAAAAQRLISS